MRRGCGTGGDGLRGQLGTHTVTWVWEPVATGDNDDSPGATNATQLQPSYTEGNTAPPLIMLDEPVYNTVSYQPNSRVNISPSQRLSNALMIRVIVAIGRADESSPPRVSGHTHLPVNTALILKAKQTAVTYIAEIERLLAALQRQGHHHDGRIAVHLRWSSGSGAWFYARPHGGRVADGLPFPPRRGLLNLDLFTARLLYHQPGADPVQLDSEEHRRHGYDWWQAVIADTRQRWAFEDVS